MTVGQTVTISFPIVATATITAVNANPATVDVMVGSQPITNIPAVYVRAN